MRATVLLVAFALLVSGCGGGKGHPTSATSTQVRTAPSPEGPQYVPGVRHKHRPPGSVYNDEIGENVVTATRSRLLHLFGPAAARHGRCLSYRIVGHSGHWLFCFRGQRMTSATTLRR